MKNDRSSKTVYFLGAGFSKAVGDLPTIDEFLNIAQFDENTSLRKFIEVYFKGSKFTIEDLLTYIEIGLSELGEKIEVPLRLLEKVREELDLYLIKRLELDFQNKRKDEEFNRKYDAYEKKLKEIFNKNDICILTLNYDCIVEGILESDLDSKVIKMVKLLSSSTNRFCDEELLQEFSKDILLKLHGSLEWMSCSNPNCLLPETEKISIPEQRIIATLGNRTMDVLKREQPRCSCGTLLSPLIIPPSLNKLPKFNSLIFRIWRIAREILSEGDKIVIIGISFAPSDYYLRWLFKSAIASRQNEQKPKIEVVNKTEEKEKICSLVKEITGIEPEFKGDFDEYIKKIETN